MKAKCSTDLDKLLNFKVKQCGGIGTVLTYSVIANTDVGLDVQAIEVK